MKMIMYKCKHVLKQAVADTIQAGKAKWMRNTAPIAISLPTPITENATFIRNGTRPNFSRTKNIGENTSGATLL